MVHFNLFSHRMRYFLFCCVCLFGLLWWSYALDIPVADWFVLDQANVLGLVAEENLENYLTSLQAQTSVEIALVLVSSLEWEDISMFATRLGQEWGVGNAELDNGMVIVIAVEDRQRFIAVGYGLEWTIPDAIAKRVGERHFPYYFRNGDYFGWLQAALEDIVWYIQRDPSVIADYEPSLWDNYVLSGLPLLVYLWFLWFFLYRKKYQKAGISIVQSLFVFFVVLSLSSILFASFLACLIGVLSLFGIVKSWMTHGGSGFGGGWWSGGGSRSGWFSGWSFGWWGAGGRR